MRSEEAMKAKIQELQSIQFHEQGPTAQKVIQATINALAYALDSGVNWNPMPSIDDLYQHNSYDEQNFIARGWKPRWNERRNERLAKAHTS